MIFYSTQMLEDAGIQGMIVVAGGRNADDFLRLQLNGQDVGLRHINYSCRQGEGGIAEAQKIMARMLHLRNKEEAAQGRQSS